MQRLRLSLVVLLAGLLASACTPVIAPVAPTWTGPPATIPGGATESHFAPSPALQFLVDPYPATEGPSWLGADVASSIEVDDGRYIWLFGDTLLGSVEDRCPDGQTYCDRRVDREGVAMIRNSVGVAERDADGSFRRVVKFWPTRAGEPTDVFASGVDGEFLWPLSGTRVGGAVFVAANRHTPSSGLAPVGNVVVRIANPAEPPSQWRLTRHEMPNFRAAGDPAPSLVWTMAMAQVGDYAYVFGEIGSAADARTVLARMSADDMAAPDWTPHPEYLVRDADGRLRWSERFDVSRLHEIRGLPGTSETTVQYDPEVGWYSYQLPPLEFDIHLYTAPDIEGPWRDSGIVYGVPAPWSTTRRGDCTPDGESCNEYIVYAVKAHPELAPTGGRALSYNVNLGSGNLGDAEAAAETTAGFYVPRMIVGPARPTIRHAGTAKTTRRSTAP